MTRKNRKCAAQPGQFEKKLAAYTLAGAAALVAPGMARASGITYVSNVDVIIDQTGSYDFNLSGPSSDDITILATLVTGSNGVEATPNSGAAVLGDGIGGVDALSFGDVIDPTNTKFQTSTKEMVNTTGGNWSQTGGQAYLGFYFNGPTNPQAGWALISTTANNTASSFEILSYAYEDSANTPIDAGDTGAVPEPSSMALLALGGAGLLALRKRRAARNS